MFDSLIILSARMSYLGITSKTAPSCFLYKVTNEVQVEKVSLAFQLRIHYQVTIKLIALMPRFTMKQSRLRPYV